MITMDPKTGTYTMSGPELEAVQKAHAVAAEKAKKFQTKRES